jgi:DNA-binding response OmpR family regulator
MEKILLIEDDPFLTDIYTTKFKEAGFDIESIDDGNGALEKIKASNPDLVVLDIVLPNQDGWEILRGIKASGLNGVKVIVISNLGQKDEVEKGLKMGAVKYLIKAHYTPQEIIEEIKEII